MTGLLKRKKQCIIHGHFYQPPRENPWIDTIEEQPSASPKHDWNERIYDECYRPNAFSRLLDKFGKIRDIHNNYYDLSFNIGPTLFKWIEEKHPLTAQRIIEADKKSAKRLGHGNAIAQIYNHIIMPLAEKKDKLTQIRWAKTFFRQRFERETEGIWLSETAIDMETVEALIEENIKYVILSPTQAEAISELDNPEALWQSVADGSINTKRAYRIYNRDDKGNKKGGYIDAFFFDEGISRAVSFEKLLTNSDKFGSRINNAYSKDINENEAVIIGTDGETFGHHFAYGDMCLAHFFTEKAAELDIDVVNFGYFLEHNPPRMEVKLKNGFTGGTAWSCAHGTGRWSRDCGCQTGGYDHWNQKWRGPLRTAIDFVRDNIDDKFEELLSPYCGDVWELRDKYGEFINSSSIPSKNFLLKNTSIDENDSHMIEKGVKMLEAQKYMLFAYTSCGWFFADISGLEPMQNLAYAARAIQLGIRYEERADFLNTFLDILKTAKSNIGHDNGKTLFNRHIKPMLEHREILCFTAIAEKTLFTPKKRKYFYFDFTVTVSENDSNVHLKNSTTGEDDNYKIKLLGKNETLSAKVTKIEENSDDEREVSVDLSDIFHENKTYFTDNLAKNISNRGNRFLGPWLENNSAYFEELVKMNGELPQSLHGPILFLLNERWDNTIDKIFEDADSFIYTSLKDIKNDAEHYSIKLNLDKTVEKIEATVRNEISRLLSNHRDFSFYKIRFLLDLADDFEIPLSKNYIEDRFYSAFDMVLKDTEARKVEHISEELLEFAERLNFSVNRTH